MAQQKKRGDNVTEKKLVQAWHQLWVENKKRPSVRAMIGKTGGSTTTIRRFLASMPGSPTWKNIKGATWVSAYFEDANPNHGQLYSAYKAHVLKKINTVWPTTTSEKLLKLAILIRVPEFAVRSVVTGEQILDVVQFVVWCEKAGLDPMKELQEIIDLAKTFPHVPG